MQIRKEFFLDKSEPDEKGFYDYWYEGHLYEITFEKVVYYARSYTESPHELFFLSLRVDGQKCMFPKIRYEEEHFWECIRHFRELLGFQEFKMLTGSGARY